MGLPVRQSASSHFPADEATGVVRWDQDLETFFKFDGAAWVSASAAEIAAAIAAHVLAADPHTQYQRESERGAASGYASLDANVRVTEQVKVVHSGTLAQRPVSGDGPGHLFFATDAGAAGRLQFWRP